MAEVVTFGCRLNLFEGEVIKEKARQAGVGEDYFIINSCTVTKQAERDVLKEIRRLKRQNPSKKIIVTGCAAQINPQKFAGLAEVDFVIGNKEKMEGETYKMILDGKMPEVALVSPQSSGERHESHQRHEDKIFFESLPSSVVYEKNKIHVRDIMQVRETASHMVQSFEGHSRAFLEIQNGCNHRCTFCIIPFARGNSRSVPFGELVSEVRNLVENGYKEVVLTGVDITDYGKDLPNSMTLGQMLKRLLNLVPQLPRLRLSSVDVAEVCDDLYDLVANESRFMPYFHISLQSGDNLILKRMKRRHSREDALKFVQKVRGLRPEAAFGADIIAGFPTEGDENFTNSLRLIEECGLSFCHVFTFSPHDGTPAAKMPQVLPSVAKERSKLLIGAGKVQLEKLLKGMVGSVQKVLIEAGSSGRCENFVTGVFKRSDGLLQGSIVSAKVIDYEGEKLLFELL